MGWQPGKGDGAGDTPGSFPELPGEDPLGGDTPASGAGGQPGAARDPWLDGFNQGGMWDTTPPGPVLAAILARVAGPDWRCPQATDDELTGVLRRLAAMESWAAAGRLAVTRELIRRDDFPHSGRSRHGDLPDAWDETVDREISLALGITVLAAGGQSLLAWELGARLPGIARLLQDGTLSLAKARVIAEAWVLLSDEDAARAEAMLITQLTGKPSKTPGQLAALAERIAAQVDPGLAQRRREAAEKVARIELFRETSGTAALSGRDLPPDEALAAMASVSARAEEYRDSGAFGKDARMDAYRATAYLDLLNGVAAWERIAYGYLTGADPGPGSEPDSNSGPDDSGPASPERPDDPSPGSGPDGAPGAPPPTTSPGPRPSDGEGATGGGEDTYVTEPGDGGPAPSGNGGPDDAGATEPNVTEPNAATEPNAPDPGDHGGLGNSAGGGPPGYQPRLTDLVIPLTTLEGRANRPGESHGFGVLDPGLCRHLATFAIRSIHTTVCLTVTDENGTAVGHGCIGNRPRGPTGRQAPVPPGDPPPLADLPARLNLTVTVDQLAALLAGPPGTLGPPGASGWTITPGTVASHKLRGRPLLADGPPLPNRLPAHSDPNWCRAWTLRMPGDLEFTIHVKPVPTHSCDHRYESHGYQPSGTLRHLVQVRDRTCTFPTCSRHARESDFEHAMPYDKGGRTCPCNAGARSRSCHRVKQAPGWTVTQPKPGWHQWQTPSGRTYIQDPYLYPV